MWTKIAGFFGVLSAVFFGLLQRQKVKAIQSDLDDEKAVTELNKQATEAYIEGEKDENAKVTRGHFND